MLHDIKDNDDKVFSEINDSGDICNLSEEFFMSLPVNLPTSATDSQTSTLKTSRPHCRHYLNQQ